MCIAELGCRPDVPVPCGSPLASLITTGAEAFPPIPHHYSEWTAACGDSASRHLDAAYEHTFTSLLALFCEPPRALDGEHTAYRAALVSSLATRLLPCVTSVGGGGETPSLPLSLLESSDILAALLAECLPLKSVAYERVLRAVPLPPSCVDPRGMSVKGEGEEEGALRAWALCEPSGWGEAPQGVWGDVGASGVPTVVHCVGVTPSARVPSSARAVLGVPSDSPPASSPFPNVPGVAWSAFQSLVTQVRAVLSRGGGGGSDGPSAVTVVWGGDAFTTDAADVLLVSGGRPMEGQGRLFTRGLSTPSPIPHRDSRPISELDLRTGTSSCLCLRASVCV